MLSKFCFKVLSVLILCMAITLNGHKRNARKRKQELKLDVKTPEVIRIVERKNDFYLLEEKNEQLKDKLIQLTNDDRFERNVKRQDGNIKVPKVIKIVERKNNFYLMEEKNDRIKNKVLQLTKDDSFRHDVKRHNDKIYAPKNTWINRITEFVKAASEIQKLKSLAPPYRYKRAETFKNEEMKAKKKAEFNEIFRAILKKSEQNLSSGPLRNNNETESAEEPIEVLKYMNDIDFLVKDLDLTFLREEWEKILIKIYYAIAPEIDQLHQKAEQAVGAQKLLRNAKYQRVTKIQSIGGKKESENKTEASCECNKVAGASKLLHKKRIWSDWKNPGKIPVDDCPGELVKHGHLCIELPPHLRLRV